MQLRTVLLYYVNVHCKSSSAPNGKHCQDYNAHFDRQRHKQHLSSQLVAAIRQDACHGAPGCRDPGSAGLDEFRRLHVMAHLMLEPVLNVSSQDT
jgi:hypothetical protein